MSELDLKMWKVFNHIYFRIKTQIFHKMYKCGVNFNTRQLPNLSNVFRLRTEQ